jgi:alkyl hydroperoxide reductase subunit F
MAASVYAARKKIDTVLLAKDIGGQVLMTLSIENYLGYQFIEGPDLIGKFEEQVRQFPLEMKIGPSATQIKKIDNGFEVEVDDGSVFQAKSVLLATGKRPRPLNVPGENELVGRGVTYCAICDGPVFSGQRVAIIGGGNSALEAVDDMLKIAEHIDLVSVTQLTGDQVLIDKIKTAENLTQYLEYEVVEIQGDGFVESFTIRDLKTKETKELEVGGVFIEIGLLPNSALVKGLVELNGAGEIIINASNEASLPGVFAAGDVTNIPEKQIVVAAGEGAKATLRANSYLQRL